MIVTVTMNPAIDKTLIFDSIKLGEVNRIKENREDIGGKGINVSKIISFFKEDTLATGIIGKNNSDKVKAFLNEINIKHDFYEVNGNTRTNIKVLETIANKTTDLNEEGLNISDQDILKFENKLFKLCKKANFIVFSGSLPKGLNGDYYKGLIKKIKKTAPVVLDTSGASLIKGIEAGPYIVKPNKEELEDAFNVKLKTNEDIINFSKDILRKYKIEIIIVTLGKEGSLLISKDNHYYAKPIPVKVLNTVGAGDSFLGGFIYGLINGDYVNALRYGAACGSLAVTLKGTGIFSKDDFIKIIDKVVIE